VGEQRRVVRLSYQSQWRVRISVRL
jgi:hypothetical protein